MKLSKYTTFFIVFLLIDVVIVLRAARLFGLHFNIFGLICFFSYIVLRYFNFLSIKSDLFHSSGFIKDVVLTKLGKVKTKFDYLMFVLVAYVLGSFALLMVVLHRPNHQMGVASAYLIRFFGF